MRVLLCLFAALAVSACGGEWISRREAYRLDMANCEARRDPEKVEDCKHLVDLRYASYWSNGDYPSTRHVPRFQR